MEIHLCVGLIINAEVHSCCNNVTPDDEIIHIPDNSTFTPIFRLCCNVPPSQPMPHYLYITYIHTYIHTYIDLIMDGGQCKHDFTYHSWCLRHSLTECMSDVSRKTHFKSWSIVSDRLSACGRGGALGTRLLTHPIPGIQTSGLGRSSFEWVRGGSTTPNLLEPWRHYWYCMRCMIGRIILG